MTRLRFSALRGPLAACALLFLGACAPEGDAYGGEGAVDERPLFPDLAQFSGLPDDPLEGASSDFWEWWGDGRAELSGYRLTLGRYGEPREAELALIYVTEPHDRRTWIKDDDVQSPHRVEMLKLISSVKFLTGIYPYSVMTSTFAPVDRYREQAFSPVRIAHSVQEWCGSYSQTLWPGPEGFRSLRLSYFAHEGERVREVDAQGELVYEDALLIQLRELDGAFAGGGDWEGLLVPELWRFRTRHAGTDPVPAHIQREEAVREDPVLGEVPVTRFTLSTDDYMRTFDVEREEPRRVLGWTTSLGDEASLLATERLDYWRLNRLGDEAYREALGLSPLAAVPPSTAPGSAGGCPE